MKYISIDIETTGLDSELDQVLSIGAIIEDTENQLPFNEIPKFHGVIKRNRIEGGLYAINLNKDLLETMNQYMCARDQDEMDDITNETGMQFFDESEIVQEFYYWLAENEFIEFNDSSSFGSVVARNGKMTSAITDKTKTQHITVAGKNFATFDKRFIERLPKWKQLFKIRQRIIDPAVLYVDWKEDESLPGLSQCKERAGLDNHVSHNAVEDAWDVIELIRKKYYI